MNPLRHDFIQSCLVSSETEPSSYPPSYSYLDVGCGGGIFASSAARLPATSQVTAIDPTELVIRIAKEQQRSDPSLTEPQLRYLHCAIEHLASQSPGVEAVDILTLFEVLEHVDSPSSFLELCIPHLKPGGWLIGSTIARSPLSFLTTKVIAEAPIIGVVPKDTHDWNKYINPSELRSWFNGQAPGTWGDFKTQGVVYVPALGWKKWDGTEDLGNYFFGIQKLS